MKTPETIENWKTKQIEKSRQIILQRLREEQKIKEMLRKEQKRKRQ